MAELSTLAVPQASPIAIRRIGKFLGAEVSGVDLGQQLKSREMQTALTHSGFPMREET